jgi:hypothetical protein
MISGWLPLGPGGSLFSNARSDSSSRVDSIASDRGSPGLQGHPRGLAYQATPESGPAPTAAVV